MGNSNLCYDDAHKSLDFEKNSETLLFSRRTTNFQAPIRSAIVNQVYSKLVNQKPLQYSLEQIKNRFEPTPVTIYGQGGFYIGELKDGRPHGPGQFYFSNSNYLEAIFLEGDISCDDAILIESNGNYYRGGFDKAVQTGKGVLRTSGGEWRGRFSAGRISGNGELQFQDGRIYHGYFKSGKMEGKGKLTSKTGETYEGYFKKGKRYGIGHLITNKYEYYGPFSEDVMEGKGTLILANGDKFEGWFEQGKLNGYGQFHRKSGGVSKKKYENQQIQKLFK